MARGSRVTEKVMQYIKEMIETGAWPVGSRIPSENQLCQDLGCSRTSVRNALQRYHVLGVIESQHGRGSFVRSGDIFIPDFERTGKAAVEVSVSDSIEKTHSYWEWRQARQVIEPEVGYRVAKKATDEFVERLRRINEEQRNAVGNPQIFIEKDIEFHMALAEFLENRIIINIMRELMDSEEMHVIGNDTFGYMGGVYFHAMITDAIARRDAEQTRALLYEHGRNNELITKVMEAGEEILSTGGTEEPSEAHWKGK